MTKGRVEAFSDGVIAILITIMVLELHSPDGAEWAALVPVLPVFLAYVLSFVILGIYWNNHHHMLHATKQVDGAVLWANLHLLFWLSLIPFGTGWVGNSHFAPLPLALYGTVLLFCAIAYTILQTVIIAHHGMTAEVAEALHHDLKGKASLVLYAAAIPLGFVWRWLAVAIYVTVALVWLVPDRRIEKTLRRSA
ncbi:MAG: DUF1211 domain-containing protein [Acidobacteria bacterium]|nr:DUF1211 domain-containing protein [Acidobacteriota bacterium]MBV9476979.1 DUF1211 domain-containing protein [Acidobacteriota bacterium]